MICWSKSKRMFPHIPEYSHCRFKAYSDLTCHQCVKEDLSGKNVSDSCNRPILQLKKLYNEVLLLPGVSSLGKTKQNGIVPNFTPTQIISGLTVRDRTDFMWYSFTTFGNIWKKTTWLILNTYFWAVLTMTTRLKNIWTYWWLILNTNYSLDNKFLALLFKSLLSTFPRISVNTNEDLFVHRHAPASISNIRHFWHRWRCFFNISRVTKHRLCDSYIHMNFNIMKSNFDALKAYFFKNSWCPRCLTYRKQPCCSGLLDHQQKKQQQS